MHSFNKVLEISFSCKLHAAVLTREDKILIFEISYHISNICNEHHAVWTVYIFRGNIELF